MRSRDGKFYCSDTPDGSFRIKFYDSGGKIHSRNVKNKTDRDQFIRAIKRREPLGRWFPDDLEPGETSIGTFAGLAEAWLDHAANVREISESCLINYRAHLRNHIFPVLGEVKLDHLRLSDIEKLASILKNKKPKARSYTAVRSSWDDQFFEDDEFLSTSYRRELPTVVVMITRWGTQRGRRFLVENPFEDYELPEKPEQPYDYWRLEDEDKFLDWIEAGGYYEKTTTRYRYRTGEDRKIKLQIRKPEEIRDMVLFMLRSGIRPGELGGLCLKDVNFGEGWIRVRDTFSRKENRYKKTTKNKKFRYVEMNADMRQILLRRREIPPGQPVFNIRMNSIKFFSRTCRLAWVREIHFHALRHTCSTNLANGYGMDRPLPIVKVQQIAGHAEVKTTMRYVHAGGVEDTTSGQWSREQRLAKRENDQNTNPPPGGPVAEVSTLRVLPNSERPQRKRLQLAKLS